MTTAESSPVAQNPSLMLSGCSGKSGWFLSLWNSKYMCVFNLLGLLSQNIRGGVADKQRNLLISFSATGKTGKPKIKLWVDLVSGEDPLPGEQTAVFSLCPHMAEGVRELSGASFTRALIPFTRAPTSWPHWLQKTPPPNTITVGLGFTIWILVSRWSLRWAPKSSSTTAMAEREFSERQSDGRCDVWE